MREKIFWENIFSSWLYVVAGLNKKLKWWWGKLLLIILQHRPKAISNWNVNNMLSGSKNYRGESEDFTRNDKVKRIYNKKTTQALSWLIIAIWWSGTTTAAGERDTVSHGKSWRSVLEHAVLLVVEKMAFCAGGSHRMANGHDPLSWTWNCLSASFSLLPGHGGSSSSASSHVIG